MLGKILWGTGLTALAGGTAYAFSLNRFAKELEVIPSAILHKMDLTGIYIRIDAIVKNPTNTKLKINYPFLKLIHKDTVIGSSQAKNEQITIPKMGEVKISGIMIQIPILGAFSLAANLIKDLQAGEKIVMSVRTLTSLNFFLRKIPYQSTQDITLKG